MLSFVCIALLVSNAVAWPQKQAQNEPADGPTVLSTLPQEFQDQLPPSVKQELNFLTTKDLLVLKNVAHELPKFTSLMQIRQVLKQYSPRLEKIAEQKAFKIMGVVAMKRAQLLPETKNAFHEAGQMSKTYAQSLVKLVQSQPEKVKNNLDTTFPHASYVLNSPLARKLIEKLQHH